MCVSVSTHPQQPQILREMLLDPFRHFFNKPSTDSSSSLRRNATRLSIRAKDRSLSRTLDRDRSGYSSRTSDAAQVPLNRSSRWMSDKFRERRTFFGHVIIVCQQRVKRPSIALRVCARAEKPSQGGLHPENLEPPVGFRRSDNDLYSAVDVKKTHLCGDRRVGPVGPVQPSAGEGHRPFSVLVSLRRVVKFPDQTSDRPVDGGEAARVMRRSLPEHRLTLRSAFASRCETTTDTCEPRCLKPRCSLRGGHSAVWPLRGGSTDHAEPLRVTRSHRLAERWQRNEQQLPRENVDDDEGFTGRRTTAENNCEWMNVGPVSFDSDILTGGGGVFARRRLAWSSSYEGRLHRTAMLGHAHVSASAFDVRVPVSTCSRARTTTTSHAEVGGQFNMSNRTRRGDATFFVQPWIQLAVAFEEASAS
ncbi:hypothetical protein BIW11_04227 [Tropilaelaps mercedesae]|uniref:Uncharacterized protein n=1 Tax=Tropilaelaps mercedesae TaxID=418985 RepID=A0A1V9X938_9ACAR|nr:hypothetical protein BIW11_04227 [Tropilaelaps mercedesae]